MTSPPPGSPTPAPAPSRHALAFIFVTMLVDSIGYGIVIPVMPQLVLDVADVDLATATRLGGLLLVVFASLQFLCGPLIGNLSDRFGRRPVLLGSLFAFGLDYLAMAFAPSLAWLFVGRAIAGIAGASFAPAASYVADVTPPDRRAAGFGLMGAAFGAGFVLGPALGGLLGESGPRAPFYASAALAGLNVLYGWFVLPESLRPENRRPFEWKRANPIGAFLTFRRQPAILGLAAILLLWQIAFQVYPSTWAFYAIARFDWSPGQIGLSLAVTGVFMALVQGFGTGRLVKRIGERRAAFLGMAVGSAGFLTYGLLTKGWIVYAVMPFTCLQAIAYPSLNGLISKSVAANEQGAIQGGVASIYGLASIIGPLLMTQSLAAAERWSQGAGRADGAALFLAAGLGVVCMLSLARWGQSPKDEVLG
jgi:DHA1 family tetracycline resistance protein-like MFS transporter